MTNRELAAALFNVATLLRDRQDNPYRIQAYLDGARTLMRRTSEDMVMPLRETETMLPHPKGILGERVQRRLQEYVRTGQMSTLLELCEGLPPYIGALMSVPGIGPRRAQQLHDALGVETPEQLVAAARMGKLQSVWGFGEKRAEQIAQLSLFEDSDFASSGRMAA